MLVDPGQDGLVILLCELSGVETAGEAVDCLNRKSQMRIFEVFEEVETDQLPLQHEFSI